MSFDALGPVSAVASSDSQEPWIAKLCPGCALCCDSTLFSSVVLSSNKEKDRCQALHFKILENGLHGLFAQSCCQLKKGRCIVYGDRPKQCRLFECKLLKESEAGILPLKSALKIITQTKQLAQETRQLLSRIGFWKPDCALSLCYQNCMRSIGSMSEEQLELLGQVILDTHQLTQKLKQCFYLAS